MGRRKKVNADQSANTTVSTPELAGAKKKKKRMDDEQSIVESLLSNNRYSTGGTAINDSDLGDFGGEPDTVQEQSGQRITIQAAETNAPKVKLPPLVVKKIALDKLSRKITALGVNAEYKLSGIGT